MPSRAERSACCPGHHSPRKQPQDRRREGCEHVVDGKSGQRRYQNRPPPKSVAQASHNRREYKLDHGEGEGQPPGYPGGVGQALAGKVHDKLWQDRHDDPEPDHVHKDRGNYDCQRQARPDGAVHQSSIGRYSICVSDKDPT